MNLKFGLSEKHTKFPHDFDKSADLISKCQNHKEDFFELCVLLKKTLLAKRVIQKYFFFASTHQFCKKQKIPMAFFTIVTWAI